MAFISQIQPLRTETIDLGDGRTVRLLAPIGKGCAATVYRAEMQTKNGLRRPVAAKLFSAVSSDEGEQVFASLVNTAQRTACVSHPNVVQMHEVLEFSGQPCLITELVDGISLADLQGMYIGSKRRMPLDLALFIANETSEALAGARVARGPDGLQLGMVHHGISPREVLLSWRGEVKVSDFEVQNVRAASSSIRSLRQLAARAVTMAPEVAKGIDADARSDVFAFGVMLYEMLIGPRFPQGLSNSDAIRLAREGYVQPQTFKRNLPEGVLTVMNRCLEVDPEKRYPNAVALAYDLRRVVLALGVGDGRYFLRTTLEREFSERGEEATSEVNLPPMALNLPPTALNLPPTALSSNDSSDYEVFEGEVVELSASARRKTRRR